MVKKIREPPEDYDQHWGFTSFLGKRVLEFGADWGSTAYYFLEHGAIKVIAVEGSKESASELFNNYGSEPDIVCIEKMILSPDDFENLISSYEADIIKVDIEGAEKHILGVSVDTILKIKEWLVETHSEDLFTKFYDLFINLGYTVTVHYEHPAERVKVIWARRS